MCIRFHPDWTSDPLYVDNLITYKAGTKENGKSRTLPTQPSTPPICLTSQRSRQTRLRNPRSRPSNSRTTIAIYPLPRPDTIPLDKGAITVEASVPCVPVSCPDTPDHRTTKLAQQDGRPLQLEEPQPQQNHQGARSTRACCHSLHRLQQQPGGDTEEARAQSRSRTQTPERRISRNKSANVQAANE